MRTTKALLILLVASSVLADEPLQSPTAAELYPLQVGNKWDFVMTQPNGAESQLSYIIRKTETIDGVELHRLETQVDDKSVLATEHLHATAEGVFRHRFNGAEITPPLKLLSNPLKPGEEWPVSVTISGEKVKGACKLGKPVDIEVPAGEFKAYELTIEVKTESGVTVESNYWLVPKVGIVMQNMVVEGKEVFNVQLAKFTPGKEKDKKSPEKKSAKKEEQTSEPK